MEKLQKYSVIGLMSGTSLDGLDIAGAIFFTKENSIENYQIICAQTVTFPNEIEVRLRNALQLNEKEIEDLDIDLGKWIGNVVLTFISENELNPDFIASHGHTIYHQPSKGITLQIGNGKVIHEVTGIPVIYDFRTLDVKRGGQGAPLVPIGDEILFHDYQFCLNLGGFANISFNSNGVRQAFDICAVNIVLNQLAAIAGHPYDFNGEIAAIGKPENALSESLRNLTFYKLPHPKSLGKEWVDEHVLPLLTTYEKDKVEDLLHTYTVHVATIISEVINNISEEYFNKRDCQVLATGGGVYNKFLIDSIRQQCAGYVEIVIPENRIIDYKEALVFALMGVLRVMNQPNCLKSVTGASQDSVSGIIIDNSGLIHL